MVQAKRYLTLTHNEASYRPSGIEDEGVGQCVLLCCSSCPQALWSQHQPMALWGTGRSHPIGLLSSLPVV